MCSPVTFGYARCSTSGQADEGYSLDYQRDLLIKVGVRPENIFTDVCSGTRRSRDGFDRLMSAVRAGDTIVTFRLDRIGRSMHHLVETLETLESKGVQLKSLTEGIDTSSAAGRAFFGMAAVFAQFERDLLVERTREGLRAARRKGHTGGRPRTPSKDVQRALKQYKSGDYSVREIASMNNMSVTTLYRYIHESDDAGGFQP